ncbi:MAG: thioredoxin domain-containing protein [Armatimonadota bacterium]
MNSSNSQSPRFENRLIHEKSPYLRQHAHNPVDWWPWCEEALTLARKLDVPIFLSVGYAACHWCHVMEHESFENEQVAELLNGHYVAIKVDREERPDIDEVYMTAVQRMTGHGGWPMSVFLTPDGRPFYGGTYFPLQSRGGRIGFISLLTQLAAAWNERRQEVEAVATAATDELALSARQRPLELKGDRPDSQSLAKAAIQDLADRFDPDFGGFGGAPKFPPHHALRLLSTLLSTQPETIAPMLEDTLDQIACGGIHDHVGGGFHRYATDRHWFTPHFEKMLYDNAMLARIYALAAEPLGRESFLTVATRTCDYVIRDLTDPIGAFRSAYDADANGKEGSYTVWDYADVTRIAGDDFAKRYNAKLAGNWRDEATGHPESTNILHIGSGIGDVRYPATDALMLSSLNALLEERNHRIPPLCDHKVLVSWNGLMIGALAAVGKVSGRADFIDAAINAANAILNHAVIDGHLRHSITEATPSPTAAFLDDYAFFADGLLDLHQVTGDDNWLCVAKSLADQMITQFTDTAEDGFFFTSETLHERLIVRTKDIFDGALPSANNVAMRVLLRLGGNYKAIADKHFATYAGVLERAPSGTATWVDALAAYGKASELTMTSEPVHLNVEPGTHTEVRLILSIPSGWHIPPRRPESAGQMATICSLETILPADLGPIEYPLPVPVSTETTLAADLTLGYTGTIALTIPVHINRDARSGHFTLTASVRTQPCTERECLAPLVITTAITITIN